MKNIVWSKEELKNIKKIILNRASFRLTDDFELINQNNTVYNYNKANTSYVAVSDELEKLLYTENKEEFTEVLAKASKVKVDLDNILHYGLIMSLSKINPNKKEENFIIFKEIVAQYDKSISYVANKIVENLDSENIKLIISNINNSQVETQEEILIKKEIQKVFAYTNGVTEDKIFTSLIEKLNKQIKHKLIKKLEAIRASRIKTEMYEKDHGFERTRLNFTKQYQKANMSKLKKRNAKFYN